METLDPGQLASVYGGVQWKEFSPEVVQERVEACEKAKVQLLFPKRIDCHAWATAVPRDDD